MTKECIGIEELERKPDQTNLDYIYIKNAYNDAREKQRNLIIDHLNNNGFNATSHGGRGSKNYTANGTLEITYDLSSYKYIKATKDELEVFISLQSPKQNPKSLNRVTLTDRIGVRVYPKNQLVKEQAEKDFNELKLTGIDLPVTRETLEELLEFINNQIELIQKK